MAKTKRRRSYRRYLHRPRRKGKLTIPLAPIVGLGIVAAQPIEMAVMGDPMGGIAEFGARLTGYNYQSKQFDPMYAAVHGWLPIIAGIVVHKTIGKPINKVLARAKIPYVRV